MCVCVKAYIKVCIIVGIGECVCVCMCIRYRRWIVVCSVLSRSHRDYSYANYILLIIINNNLIYIISLLAIFIYICDIYYSKITHYSIIIINDVSK